MKVVLIGTGNVATHLGIALQSKGFSILQVYSRTVASASLLARQLHVPYTTCIQEITSGADLYILSIKDDAVKPLLSEMMCGDALYIHTAGSVSLSIFKNHARRYGVLYPLQTFSKSSEISFDHIPLLFEANSVPDTELLRSVAEKLSDTAIYLNSKQRKNAHLAAVFACNFVNHMYSLASDILEENHLPRNILFPLIRETAEKAENMHPKKAQTGPAVRIDRQTMQKHLEMLTDEHKKRLYEFISNSIIHSKEK